MTRQLATIRRISELKPIEGADAIELAVVDGWQSVVKKGQFVANQVVCYIEIDAWVPHSIAPFLTKPGHFPKVYQGVEGQRLRTVKLRGALSQGLILEAQVVIDAFTGSKFDEGQELIEVLYEGADVTDILGILKWEKEIPAQLAGTVRGNFPSVLRKTDQERIQNLTKKFESYKGFTWEVTEKLDGSSCTFFLDAEGVFHVCSRNLDLKEDENNSFWKAARKYNVEQLMRDSGLTDFAIQGELIGPGIQGNQYERSDLEFYMFDMFDVKIGRYLTPEERTDERFNHFYSIPSVPIIYHGYMIGELVNVHDLLKLAEGTSALNNSLREGLVFKCYTLNQHEEVESFKVISNTWLQKYE